MHNMAVLFGVYAASSMLLAFIITFIATSVINGLRLSNSELKVVVCHRQSSIW